MGQGQVIWFGGTYMNPLLSLASEASWRALGVNRVNHSPPDSYQAANPWEHQETEQSESPEAVCSGGAPGPLRRDSRDSKTKTSSDLQINTCELSLSSMSIKSDPVQLNKYFLKRKGCVQDKGFKVICRDGRRATDHGGVRAPDPQKKQSINLKYAFSKGLDFLPFFFLFLLIS